MDNASEPTSLPQLNIAEQSGPNVTSTSTQLDPAAVDVESDVESDPGSFHSSDADLEDEETEEGRARMRRNDKRILAGIRAQVKERNEAAFPVPPMAYQIPKELYDKAEKQQDQLTEQERQLLLSRGDFIGKALGRPESLTEAEIHELMGWPAPDVVRASILRVTGGALSTVAEFIAKAREANERGDLRSLSFEELGLIGRNFREETDNNTDSRMLAMYGSPGIGQAMKLIGSRQGVPQTVMPVMKYWTFDPAILVERNAQWKAQYESRRRGPTNMPVRQGGGGGPSFEHREYTTEAILNRIADRMEMLQQKRDRGDIAEDEFRYQNQGQIAAIRSFANHRKGARMHPYSHSSHGPQAAGSISPPVVSLRSASQQLPSASANFTTSTQTSSVPSVLATPSYSPAGTGAAPLSNPAFFAPVAATYSAPPPVAATFSAPPPVVLNNPQPPRPANRDFNWAPGLQPLGPLNFFVNDLKQRDDFGDNFATNLAARWNALGEEQKAAYQDMSEAARLQGWEDYRQRHELR